MCWSRLTSQYHYEAIDGSKIPPVSVCGLQRSQWIPQLGNRNLFRNEIWFQNFIRSFENSVTVYDLDAEYKWKRISSGLIEPHPVACWQSHLQIYFDIVSERPTVPVLILEDDVVIPQNIKETAIDILERLPSSWKLFFFGFRALPPPRTVETKNGFAKLKFVVNSHAYAVRNERRN